jgi:hypothetical protein
MDVFKGLLVGIPVSLFIWTVRHSEPDPCGTNINAFSHAESFVGQRLRNSASAEFHFSRAQISELECGIWSVTSYVDAQNGFGATVRTPFHVVVERQSDNRWTLISIQLN